MCRSSGGDSFLDYFYYFWVDGAGDVEVEMNNRKYCARLGGIKTN